MSKLLKGRMSAEYEAELRGCEAILFLEYKGVGANDTVEARRELHGQDVSLKVVRNSLARIALGNLGVEGMEGYLEGPTAVAYGGEDPVALSKAVAEVGKKYEGYEVKGGYLEGRPLTAVEVTALAKVPPREVLISQIMAGFQAPVSRLATALNDINGRLVRVLAQVRDQKEEAGS